MIETITIQLKRHHRAIPSVLGYLAAGMGLIYRCCLGLEGQCTSVVDLVPILAFDWGWLWRIRYGTQYMEHYNVEIWGSIDMVWLVRSNFSVKPELDVNHINIGYSAWPYDSLWYCVFRTIGRFGPDCLCLVNAYGWLRWLGIIRCSWWRRPVSSSR